MTKYLVTNGIVSWALSGPAMDIPTIISKTILFIILFVNGVHIFNNRLIERQLH